MKIKPFCGNPPNFVLAVLACFAFSTEVVFGQTDTKGIVLQRNWDSSTEDGDLVVNELRGLLSSVGKAARNLDPAPNLELYHGVTYLMPLKEAVKQLGVLVAVGAKHMVICPGFPYRTLFVYSYNYLQEEGFNEVHLVTDKADQVVAVQLYSGNGWKLRRRHQHDEVPKFNTYDFINSRAKALTSARVGHRVDSQYDKWFITLESDFRDPTGNVYRYTRLFLPKPLVELILFRIEKIKSQSSR